MIIYKRSQETNFSYHWRCDKARITHHGFADDLLLFCGKNVSSALILKRSLEDFSLLTGLEANKLKSTCYVAGSDSSCRDSIGSIFGFPLGSLPFKYLGVPLITTRLIATDCKILVDKFIARVKCWTTKYLSFAGCLQLIKSVLFNLQVNWYGIFILPKKVFKRVE